MVQFQWFLFIDSGVIFIMLTLAVYHFLIFAGRLRSREERGNLYLAFFNLGLAFYTFMNSLWRKKSGFYFPGAVDPFVEGLLFFS